MSFNTTQKGVPAKNGRHAETNAARRLPWAQHLFGWAFGVGQSWCAFSRAKRSRFWLDTHRKEPVSGFQFGILGLLAGRSPFYRLACLTQNIEGFHSFRGNNWAPHLAVFLKTPSVPRALWTACFFFVRCYLKKPIHRRFFSPQSGFRLFWPKVILCMDGCEIHATHHRSETLRNDSIPDVNINKRQPWFHFVGKSYYFRNHPQYHLFPGQNQKKADTKTTPPQQRGATLAGRVLKS